MLKPLESILEPDARHRNSVSGLAALGGRPFQIEDLYALVRPLELGPGVPNEIRIQFDAARHAFIYSWFAYDLVTLAESHAYGALENALHLRAEREGRKTRRGLRKRIDDAVAWGWLNPRDYEMPTGTGGTVSLLDMARELRNRLAHGAVHLYPQGSLAMIELCGAVITKLFPVAQSDQT